MLRTTPKTTGLALALALGGPAIFGCDIPVFRYALDRWPADAFRLEAPTTVLQTEPLATEIRNLSGGAGLNLEASISTNSTRMFFPSHVRGAAAPVWEGKLSLAAYRTLTDSPARQDLIKRILAGDSAIWVLVESGHRDQDEAAARLLAGRLRFLEAATGLPPLDPNDPESRLGPGPELKVQFSLLRVKRTDANEFLFLSLLAGPTGLKSFPAEQPFVAVVFGRGRVFGAWPHARLTEDLIEEATRFLLGSCSCEVKAQNPGWDLLLRVDWDNELKKIGAIRRPASNAPKRSGGSL
ncbi:MAG: hypothetical protein WCO56_03895 [Verrucomicrobiota bacterium]